MRQNRGAVITLDTTLFPSATVIELAQLAYDYDSYLVLEVFDSSFSSAALEKIADEGALLYFSNPRAYFVGYLESIATRAKAAGGRLYLDDFDNYLYYGYLESLARKGAVLRIDAKRYYYGYLETIAGAARDGGGALYLDFKPSEFYSSYARSIAAKGAIISINSASASGEQYNVNDLLAIAEASRAGKGSLFLNLPFGLYGTADLLRLKGFGAVLTNVANAAGLAWFEDLVWSATNKTISLIPEIDPAVAGQAPDLGNIQIATTVCDYVTDRSKCVAALNGNWNASTIIDRARAQKNLVLVTRPGVFYASDLRAIAQELRTRQGKLFLSLDNTSAYTSDIRELARLGAVLYVPEPKKFYASDLRSLAEEAFANDGALFVDVLGTEQYASDIRAWISAGATVRIRKGYYASDLRSMASEAKNKGVPFYLSLNDGALYASDLRSIAQFGAVIGITGSLYSVSELISIASTARTGGGALYFNPFSFSYSESDIRQIESAGGILTTNLDGAAGDYYGYLLDQVENFPAPPATFDIVNGASYAPAISRGSIATIFGSGITTVSGVVSANTVPLPTTLRGTRVRIGGYNAPIFAVAKSGSLEQINVQVPNEATSPATVEVYVNDRLVASKSVPVNEFAPGIFFYDSSNQAGSITDSATYKLITAQNPAAKGSYVVLWATGLGLSSPVVATNQATPMPTSSSGPFYRSQYSVSVSVGGVAVPVTFSGLAPGFIGLYQVVVPIPTNIPSGQVDVRLSVGSSSAAVVRTFVR